LLWLDYPEERGLPGFPPRVRVPGRGFCAYRCLHKRIVGKRLTLLLRLPALRSRDFKTTAMLGREASADALHTENRSKAAP
jgi:hypothetical protein